MSVKTVQTAGFQDPLDRRFLFGARTVLGMKKDMSRSFVRSFRDVAGVIPPASRYQFLDSVSRIQRDLAVAAASERVVDRLIGSNRLFTDTGAFKGLANIGEETRHLAKIAAVFDNVTSRTALHETRTLAAFARQANALAPPSVFEKYAAIGAAFDSAVHHKALSAASAALAADRLGLLGRSHGPAVIFRDLERSALIGKATRERHLGWSLAAERLSGFSRILDNVARLGAAMDPRLPSVANLFDRPAFPASLVYDTARVAERFGRVGWPSLDPLIDRQLAEPVPSDRDEAAPPSSAGVEPSAPAANGLLSLQHLVSSSPFRWIGQDAGLLLALTTEHLSYGGEDYATADELLLEVARNPRLHAYIHDRLVTLGAKQAKLFALGADFFRQGCHDAAITLLIVQLEGLLTDLAIYKGLAARDPAKPGKPRKVGTPHYLRSAEDTIKLLAGSSHLTADEDVFLRLHVYGGNGDSYRHGPAERFHALDAASLVLGFYLALSSFPN